MKRTVLTGAIASIFSLTLLSSAFAGEEVLMRNDMTFHECPAAIDAMLKHLGANSNHVQTISDTGAHYYVELASSNANLEFRCNAVSEQITIARITPGTLDQMASD